MTTPSVGSRSDRLRIVAFIVIEILSITVTGAAGDDQAFMPNVTGILITTSRPQTGDVGHVNTAGYPDDMGYGVKCQSLFRERVHLYNWTEYDFFCICYRTCTGKPLSKEDEDVRQSALDELRNARLRDNVVEYACIAATLSLICVVGCLGNALVLVTVFLHLPGNHVTNIFITSLAVGDLLVVTICAPVRVYEYVLGRWTLGVWSCRAVLYLYYMSFLLSVFTLTAMSLERYLVICHPMRAQYVSTPGRARKIVCVIWLLASLLSLPVLVLSLNETLYMYFQDLDKREFCGLPWNHEVSLRVLMLYLTAIILGCPLVAMTYAYGRTCYTLWRSLSLARGLKACESNGGSRHSRRSGSDRLKNNAKKVKEEKGRIKVIKMLISILVVFVICWSPTLTFNTLVAFRVEPEERVTGSRLALALAILALANSCVNPFLYAFLSTSFRRGFCKCFRVCSRRRRKSDFMPVTEIGFSTTGFTGLSRDDPDRAINSTNV